VVIFKTRPLDECLSRKEKLHKQCKFT